ncbi:MAG TPA: aminoglycoside phosphotransferase family protein [Acidothermaceae bacterium]|nr:aminoglycoside phosphotransferase family protein [Acidothermaceae bacterium]
MDDALVARAIAAASSVAQAAGLQVNEAVVISNSNKLALHLLPADTFARAALVGQQVAALEVRVAQSLAALAAPIASLDPRVEPLVYERDGFAVTFWSYYRPVADIGSSAAYADALHRLHAAMRKVEIEAPHFTERIAEAEQLLTHRQETPALADDDRVLVLGTLRAAAQAISRHGDADQLLHGEPHPGNLLSTAEGLLFIDFETCCRGPIEFDVAHVPDDVSAHYPGVDQSLLQECRRLVLAMVAAWRWDVRDEFPNGRRYAVEILGVLRDGPPWPTLGALSIE